MQHILFIVLISLSAVSRTTSTRCLTNPIRDGSSATALTNVGQYFVASERGLMNSISIPRSQPIPVPIAVCQIIEGTVSTNTSGVVIGATSSISVVSTNYEIVFSPSIFMEIGTTYTFIITMDSGVMAVTYGTDFQGNTGDMILEGDVHMDTDLAFSLCYDMPPSSPPTPSMSITPSTSAGPTPSITPSIFPTSSATPTTTPSSSSSPNQSSTPSMTPSVTSSVTPSVTPTQTSSVSPTSSLSFGSSPSSTPSVTPSTSTTSSVSPSISPLPFETPSTSSTSSPSSVPSTTPTSSALPSPSVSFTPETSISPASVTPTSTPSTAEILDTFSQVNMRIEGTLATFDEDAFIDSMTDILDIDPNSLEIVSVAEGSVIVIFRIYDTDTTDSTDVVEQLQHLVDTEDPLLSDAGIVVIDISIDTLNSASANKDPTSSGGLGTGEIVAITVVIPAAAVGFVAVALVAYRRKHIALAEGSIYQNNFWSAIELKNIDNKPKKDEERMTPSSNSAKSESDEESSDESSASESESEPASESESSSESE